MATTLKFHTLLFYHMSRLMTKPTKWPERPAMTQISLGIRPVWSESSLCTQQVAKDPRFLHTDSEDSDQTGQMPRLIWVFAGPEGHFVGLSLGGSYIEIHSKDSDRMANSADLDQTGPSGAVWSVSNWLVYTNCPDFSVQIR